MLLNHQEIELILEIIAEKYGPGYAHDDRIAKLQAKLSIMLEAKARAAQSDPGQGRSE